MQSKTLPTIILLCLLCLSYSQNSWAQFKKYQAQTDLKAKESEKKTTVEEPSEAPSTPAESPEERGLPSRPQRVTEEDSMFGRSDKSFTELPEKSKQHVLINTKTGYGPEVVNNFNFVDVDILELTKYMMKLTGKNLIWDNDLKGKVNISTETPISAGSAWKAYVAVLNMRGFTVIEQGDFLKIIQSRDVQYYPTEIYENNYTPNTDNYVMRILKLKYVNSSEINRGLKPFQTRYGRIEEIKQTNDIIIVDTGTNINRLVQLIKFIDVPGHEESLQIIKVKNSSAQEIVNLLDKIFKGQTSSRFGAGRPYGSTATAKYDMSKLIAEPRTNSIIAMTNAEGAAQLRALIEKLDQKQQSKGGGQIHVEYLRHSDAEKMAETLSKLVSSAASGSADKPRYSFRPTETLPPLFNSEVKITADKSNNALVIMASPTDYLTIKNIVSKLDISKKQVYVEGLIMDTKYSDGYTFGINVLGAYGTGALDRFALAPGAGGAGTIAGLLSGPDKQLQTLGSISGLFAGGSIGRKIELDMGGQKVQVGSVNAVIQAIASDSNTNVLATPQILALDNEDAEFEVGEQIPTMQREMANNGTVLTSEKRENITMKLSITPQINKKSRNIRLKLKLSVKDFSETSVGAKDGIVTTVREANTNVIVRDKDTVGLGGLMRDRKVETVSKVPLLGDIPVLGWLFSSRQYKVEKVNMLFFMTPRILDPYEIEAPETIKDLLERRKAHLGDDAEGGQFDATSKALYQKAEKQKEGPLYDTSTIKQLEELEKSPIDQHEAGDESGDFTTEESTTPAVTVPPAPPKAADKAEVQPLIEGVSEDGSLPNYQEIMRKAKEKGSNGEKREAHIQT